MTKLDDMRRRFENHKVKTIFWKKFPGCAYLDEAHIWMENKKWFIQQGDCTLEVSEDFVFEMANMVAKRSRYG